MTIPNQTHVFLESEADSWFERNRAAINSPINSLELAFIKRTLGYAEPAIKDILEIGCSSGAKLNQLCDFFDSNGKGIDPSSAAVEAGNQLIEQQAKSKRQLHVGTAAKLPFETNAFDLVFFGFCLYVIDRSEVFQAISEADRVLKAGGFMAILDFDPNLRHKRAYHHKPGLFSYKNSYSDFFSAGGHYHLVAKDSFSHEDGHFSSDPNDRVAISLLYKELDAYGHP